MKIAAFVINGTEDSELIVPIDLWRRAGISVDLITLEKKKVTVLAWGNKICAELAVDNVNISQYDAIFLPGGPGAARYKESKKLATAAQKFLASPTKWVLALCAAPAFLGELGLLQGYKATVYPGFEGSLGESFVKDRRIVHDKNLITGIAAGAAFEFALEAIKLLVGSEKAAEVAAKTLAKIS